MTIINLLQPFTGLVTNPHFLKKKNKPNQAKQSKLQQHSAITILQAQIFPNNNVVLNFQISLSARSLASKGT